MSLHVSNITIYAEVLMAAYVAHASLPEELSTPTPDYCQTNPLSLDNYFFKYNSLKLRQNKQL
jgi:hypothetical protein